MNHTEAPAEMKAPYGLPEGAQNAMRTLPLVNPLPKVVAPCGARLTDKHLPSGDIVIDDSISGKCCPANRTAEVHQRSRVSRQCGQVESRHSRTVLSWCRESQSYGIP